MKLGNAGRGKDPNFWCAFEVGEVRVIGDEPGNTRKDPDPSEKAVSQGEGGARLPFLCALRQDLSRRHSAPRLWSGPRERGRTGTAMSMSACATSSPDGTKWQGVAPRFSCEIVYGKLGLLRLERLPRTAPARALR